MKSSGFELLAHRGWWLEAGEKNSELAFRRAFAAGMGVETDVRDHDGVLVIAHDPPVGSGHMALREFLALHAAYGSPGVLAMNVKADGLHQPLCAAFEAYPLTDWFVFDMAVPDALGYLSRAAKTFTRHSEIEPTAAFYDRADGVWVDCFEGDWISPQVVGQHLEAGKRVALVSPELHRRPHAAAWEMWAPLAGRGVMLCTDFPGDARDRFG